MTASLVRSTDRGSVGREVSREHRVSTGDVYGDPMAALWAHRDSETEYATAATWEQRHALRPVSWCGVCGRSDRSAPDPRSSRVQRAAGPCVCAVVDRRTALLPSVGVGSSADDRGSVRADMTPAVMASSRGKVQAVAVDKGGHGRTVRHDGGRVHVGRLSVLAALPARVIASTGSDQPWPNVADVLRGDMGARQRAARHLAARRVVYGMVGPMVDQQVLTAKGDKARPVARTAAQTRSANTAAARRARASVVAAL